MLGFRILIRAWSHDHGDFNILTLLLSPHWFSYASLYPLDTSSGLYYKVYHPLRVISTGTSQSRSRFHWVVWIELIFSSLKPQILSVILRDSNLSSYCQIPWLFQLLSFHYSISATLFRLLSSICFGISDARFQLSTETGVGTFGKRSSQINHQIDLFA